jgi:hypothetical protein
MTVKQASKSNVASKQPLMNKSNWVRPSDWPVLPEVLPTDKKSVMLLAIFPNKNVISFTAYGSECEYNWGDGVVETVTANAIPSHTYDYDLLPESSYSSRGYKTVILTITRVNAFTQLSLFDTGTQIPSQILEMVVSHPNSGTFIVLSPTIGYRKHRMLERFVLVSGKLSGTYTFFGCNALESISELEFSTNYLVSVFSGCSKLEYIPTIKLPAGNGSSALMYNGTFTGCIALKEVRNLPIPSGYWTTSNMFDGCTALEEVSGMHFRTTNAASMFNNCNSLSKLDCTFDFSQNTSLNATFSNCYKIKRVPDLSSHTTLLTNIQSTFLNAYSLESVSDFPVTGITSAGSTFQGCLNLQSIPTPLLDTRNYGPTTGVSTLVSFDGKLTTCPQFIIKSTATSIPMLFGQGTSLSEIPSIALPSTFSSAINLSNSILKRCGLSNITSSTVNFTGCMLTKEALEEIFSNLVRTTTTKTITVSLNPGAVSVTRSPVLNNTNVLTLSNTSGLVVGMHPLSISSSPLGGGYTVTFTASTSTVGFTNHDLIAGDIVSFPTITSTTGILINTMYYVVNPTTDTFQVSDTLGGSPLTLTTNGTGNIRYDVEITSINPNVSVTCSKRFRSSGTLTNTTFRLLNISRALHIGWTVTL